MGTDKWIEIARTGTFEDSAGRLRTFTAGDLDAIARSYDPAKRDAPLTFGHPQTDKAPAYGWVEKLKSEGGRLYANFSQVPEQVRDLVAKGHYRHVSMSLMPDLVTLRHVALLGAEQPAIDGLAAVEFTDGGDALTVDFAAGERREARVAELVTAGKVKPAEKAGVLDFAAKLAAQGGTVDFAAPDGGTESLSLEERYFRDLEARPADERGAEFSAPPAHAGGQQDNINPAELTAKL